jgi:hypothetical protein
MAWQISVARLCAEMETGEHGHFILSFLTSVLATTVVACGFLWKTIESRFHFSANVWPLEKGTKDRRVIDDRFTGGQQTVLYPRPSILRPNY